MIIKCLIIYENLPKNKYELFLENIVRNKKIFYGESIDKIRENFYKKYKNCLIVEIKQY
jgi:hypothetical protein